MNGDDCLGDQECSNELLSQINANEALAGGGVA
jgi:hypothetical protein